MLGVSWNGLGKRFGLDGFSKPNRINIPANTSLSKDQTVPVTPLKNY